MKFKIFNLSLLMLLFSGIFSSGIFAGQPLLFEEVSTDNVTYMRGIISSVSTEEMQISVRPAKGDRVVVNIDPDTQMEGTRGIEDLEKEHQVKVWYQVEDNKNTALKIEKLPDLGC